MRSNKTHGLSRRTFIACDSIKRLWRQANPNIVDFWKDLEDAAFAAVLYGRVTKVGRCTVDKKGTWLRIQLPSGRYLCYAGAQVEDKKIRYLGVNQYSRKWCRLSTYGGKLVENVTQAMSRDILGHGATLAEAAGYEVVLSVHDELITEAPDTEDYQSDELSRLLSTVPPWATGLPLSAAGFTGYRYRKD
jgi:DNA polymerase